MRTDDLEVIVHNLGRFLSRKQVCVLCVCGVCVCVCVCHCAQPGPVPVPQAGRRGRGGGRQAGRETGRRHCAQPALSPVPQVCVCVCARCVCCTRAGGEERLVCNGCCEACPSNTEAAGPLKRW